MLTIVASLVSQLVTNPSVIRETWVRSELGRSPEEGKGYALQYAGLENSMECTVHGVTKSDRTEQLSLSLFRLYVACQTPPSMEFPSKILE